jgi:hypothetical protein
VIVSADLAALSASEKKGTQPGHGWEVSLTRTYRRVAIDDKGRGGMKEESVVSVALAL